MLNCSCLLETSFSCRNRLVWPANSVSTTSAPLLASANPTRPRPAPSSSARTFVQSRAGLSDSKYDVSASAAGHSLDPVVSSSGCSDQVCPGSCSSRSTVPPPMSTSVGTSPPVSSVSTVSPVSTVRALLIGRCSAMQVKRRLYSTTFGLDAHEGAPLRFQYMKMARGVCALLVALVSWLSCCGSGAASSRWVRSQRPLS